MNKHTAQYFVGIDLGTTNTVVAYAALADKDQPQKRKIFEIEQLVAPGEVAKKTMLPSFRYHPMAGEIAAVDCQLPWSYSQQSPACVKGDFEGAIVGEWARELGAKAAGRQVHSAKSWLSHTQVERHADILPWGAAENIQQVSPVVASASYLLHVRQAWNYEHPEALLENQDIVVTVPASFDADARALTVEAAALAGLKHIRLLEEPQAVCYHWYGSNKDSVEKTLDGRRLLMVCDVGGGTTDLSLIQISKESGQEVNLTRVGVGDHLMLGGDNVDLALAHIVERRLNLPKALNAAQLSQIIAQTRRAKERLLDNKTLTQATITLVGSGSRLIAGAKSCELTQAEVTSLALEGFFPEVALDVAPKKRRSAVMEFGLPYAADPAISKHLASFISQHASVCQQALGATQATEPAVPDCILLNGGLFNSATIRQRLLAQLSTWRNGAAPALLENNTPHLAVAFGAVSYLMARAGSHKTISGGSARAFFLVLETQEGEAQQAVCLLPKGAEDGVEYLLTQQNFVLLLDQPVNFTLASTRSSKVYRAGDKVLLDDDFFLLPSLVTKINSHEVSDAKTIITQPEGLYLPVNLNIQLTEVGTLHVECLAQDNSHKWALEFEARAGQRTAPAAKAALPPNFAQVCEKIEEVFGNRKASDKNKAVKNLRKSLEGLLGPREQWDVQLLRALFDVLIEHKDKRRRSAAHERLWFNLTGYCLRPGCGDAADIWRIEKVWPLYEEFLTFDKETQSWIDFWTFWRRAAGGLDAQQQLHVFEGLAPYADPQYINSRKVIGEAKLISYDDVLRLLASLERVPQPQKITLVNHLITRLTLKNPSLISYWTIGRIATRVPFYSSNHHVIPANIAEPWLRDLLKLNWKADAQIAFCAVMMARMSGDRHRDIDSELRATIEAKLHQIKAPSAWLGMLSSADKLSSSDNEKIFGEALPAGLALLEA